MADKDGNRFDRTIYLGPGAPPGLLLSLGDGSACEGTALMLARELRKISFVPGMRSVEDLAETLAPRIIAGLIKTASEKQNV